MLLGYYFIIGLATIAYVAWFGTQNAGWQPAKRQRAVVLVFNGPVKENRLAFYTSGFV